MRQQLLDVYFVFKNVASGEKHFIFKKNILRFRAQPNKGDAGSTFLQFIMRDGERVAFILRADIWQDFERGLPSPRITDVLSHPVENS